MAARHLGRHRNHVVRRPGKTPPFGQIITFEQDGLPFIEYRAESFLLDDEGQKLRPITVETGFWQIDRPLTDADGGFGIVPKDVVPAFADAASVETLRNADDRLLPAGNHCAPRRY